MNRIAVCLLVVACVAMESADVEKSVPWNTEELLSIVPTAHPAEGLSEPGLHAVFIDALPWRGKPARFFAWYGLPESASADKPAPAMVLVHGGGGTAHLRWARQWIERGYAAIAIDTNGNMPPAGKTMEGPPEPIRNPDGGPNGSDHCFNQLDEPVEDQWAYHATANIVLANSFMRHLPEVDQDRVGLTGISWGGYLTCIAAGIDPRFRFAVPVYGCGFLADDSGWAKRFADMGPRKTAQWKELWDPANYLPGATMPMLWINGDMDDCFSLKIMRQSFRLPPGDRYLSIQPNMGHSHTWGENPPEIPAFAAQMLEDGPKLSRAVSQSIAGSLAWATFVDAPDVREARCVITTDSGQWIGRKWTPHAARWDAAESRASYEIPVDATAIYFVITYANGLMASSEPIDVKSP